MARSNRHRALDPGFDGARPLNPVQHRYNFQIGRHLREDHSCGRDPAVDPLISFGASQVPFSARPPAPLTGTDALAARIQSAGNASAARASRQELAAD